MKESTRNVYFVFGCLMIMLIIAFSVSIPWIVLFAEETEKLNSKIETLEAKVRELESRTSTGGQGGVEIQLHPEWTPIHPEDFIDFSSPYGVRRSPFTGDMVHHSGLDMFGVWHARIIVPGDGTVIEHWVPPGQRTGFVGHPDLGGCLVIQMDDGHILTLGHLSETYVREGDRVYAGKVVARQGNTGKSTGEHLHFEVEKDGEEIPPFKYMMEVSG